MRIYQLRRGAMAELARWLEETEAMWAERLTAFKAHMAARGEGA